MYEDLSYDALRYGLLNTEYLVSELDFAMWLNIEYLGQPDTTLLSLIKKPQEDVDAAVDALLPERRQFFLDFFSYLKCPRCGREYRRGENYETCPYRGSPLWRSKEEGLTDKDVSKLPHETCGAVLERVFPADVKKSVRGEVEIDVLFSHSLAALRHQVCWWIADCLYPRRKKPDEIELSLCEVFQHLRAMMEKEVDEILFHLAPFGDPLQLNGRRNLLPKGNTLEEKQRDYLFVRDKLISLHVRLAGIARSKPEDKEAADLRQGPRKFRPPISLPESLGPASMNEARMERDLTAGEAQSSGVGHGVSMLDAAMILNDDDVDLARETVRRWQKMRRPKPPLHIGFDPKHRQRKLFEPAALYDFIERIESRPVCSQHGLREGLRLKARKPR